MLLPCYFYLLLITLALSLKLFNVKLNMGKKTILLRLIIITCLIFGCGSFVRLFYYGVANTFTIVCFYLFIGFILMSIIRLLPFLQKKEWLELFKLTNYKGDYYFTTPKSLNLS